MRLGVHTAHRLKGLSPLTTGAIAPWKRLHRTMHMSTSMPSARDVSNRA